MKQVNFYILFFSLSASSHLEAKSLTIKALEAEIKKSSHVQVFEKYEVELLRKIESGQKEWVKMGFRFHKNSDGHMGEELSSALGTAMAYHPDIVLSAIDSEWQKQFLCDGPDVHDPRWTTKTACLAEVERRIVALKAKAKKSKYSQEIEKCISELEKSKPDFIKFFQEEYGQ